MEDLQNILTELGYALSPDAKGFRSKAVFRSGDNDSSLLIYRDGSGYSDFARGTRGSLYELIQLTLGLKTEDESRQWLKTKDFLFTDIKREEPKLKMQKTYPKEILNNLFPDYDYMLKRGISEETLRHFGGGLALTGKMKNRYCFVIYNSKKEIVGFNGRAVLEGMEPKYKIIGEKAKFVFPAHLNVKFIRQEKSVILVESPICMLKLWDANVKNALCLFGTELSLGILNFLLRINPEVIYVSTNNEVNLNGGVGNLAADKIKKKLDKYFNNSIIKLPTLKDFGTMSLDEIREWND